MKKFFRKTSYRAFGLVVIIALVAGFFINWMQVAQATAYLAGSMSDTMTTLKDNTTADHSIKWTLPSGVTFDIADNTDYMRVDFPAAFTLGGTWAVGDFAMTVNNGGRSLTINAVSEGAGTIDCTVADGVDNVCIAIDTTNKIFTIKPSATFTATTADQYMVLTINGTTGDGTLTNPDIAAATNYVVALAMCDEAANCSTWGTENHTGSLAVYIILDDQVVVSATVDPSITFILSDNTVELGTLSSSAISTGQITVQTVTNAVGGYSTTVLEDGELRSNGNTIDDETGDNDVDKGSEEYGMATTDNTPAQDIIYDTAANCTTPPDPKIAKAITSSAQTTAGAATGPVDETSTLCFAASVTSTTVAGSYSHTLTFVSTATF